MKKKHEIVIVMRPTMHPGFPLLMRQSEERRRRRAEWWARVRAFLGQDGPVVFALGVFLFFLFWVIR